MRRLLLLVASVPDQPAVAQTIHLLRVTFVIIAVLMVPVTVFKWMTFLRRIRNMGPLPPHPVAAAKEPTPPPADEPSRAEPDNALPRNPPPTAPDNPPPAAPDNPRPTAPDNPRPTAPDNPPPAAPDNP